MLHFSIFHFQFYFLVFSYLLFHYTTLLITVLFIRTDRLSCIHICIIYYENQGPRFGENYISAKQPNENQGDTLNASFHLLLNINRMLITRFICIQWKSSRFLSPVSMVSAGNAWEHGLGPTQEKKTRNTCIFRVLLC